MTTRTILFERALLVLTALTAIATASCGGSGSSSGTAGRSLTPAGCDPGAGPFSLSITNPFFPLPIGHVLDLSGTNSDGEVERVVITVLNQVEVVAGVTTRVVEERETADGALTEISRNFFVQAPDGTVCYFGEDTTEFAGGVPSPGADSWRAGVNGAVPGIIMPNDPGVGDTYFQENAPGVAQDRAIHTALGETVTVPAGTFSDTLSVFEDTPLDPASTSDKVYARGVGLVQDDEIELTSVQ